MAGNQEARVLFANEAFYLAFRNRDVAAMRAVWVKAEPMACTHPGWAVLRGCDEVMQSWEAILGNPGAPRVVCHGARVLHRGGQAIVTCYEVIGESVLAVSNIFVEEDGDWKMMHHHAGPCHELPPELADIETKPDSLQ